MTEENSTGLNFLDYIGLARFKGWIAGLLALKVDKETGKGLSTNDYTTVEKNKLSGIESGAQVNTVTSVNGQTGAVVIQEGGGGGEENNCDIVYTDTTYTKTDLVTGDITNVVTNADGSIVKTVSNGGIVKSTTTITYDEDEIHVRHT